MENYFLPTKKLKKHKNHTLLAQARVFQLLLAALLKKILPRSQRQGDGIGWQLEDLSIGAFDLSFLPMKYCWAGPSRPHFHLSKDLIGFLGQESKDICLWNGEKNQVGFGLFKPIRSCNPFFQKLLSSIDRHQPATSLTGRRQSYPGLSFQPRWLEFMSKASGSLQKMTSRIVHIMLWVQICQN